MSFLLLMHYATLRTWLDPSALKALPHTSPGQNEATPRE